jgi:hypothetical protein
MINFTQLKTIVFSILIFVPVLRANAVTWKTQHADWYYSQNNLAYAGYQHYEKIGDTLINNVLCDNIRCVESGYDYMISNYVSDTHYVYTYVVNDTVMEMSNQLNVLYIANAQAGASWPVKYLSSCNNAYFVVDSTENSLISNTPVRYIYGSYFQDSVFTTGTTIIEGIGSVSGLIPEMACVTDYDWFELRCFSDSDSLYYNSMIVPTCDYINDVKELSWQHVRLYPNPSYSNITFDLTAINSKLDGVEIIFNDVTGKQIMYHKPQLFEDRVDVSGFAEGFYYVQLKRDGNLMRSLQFVKVSR